MRYTLFTLGLFFIGIACQKAYVPRENISIKLKQYKFENNSIRAIEILNDTTLAYAGSNGTTGMLNQDGERFNTLYLKKDSIVPHFRSLSTTKNSVFTLSIANPALLYKIENKNSTIVYQEDHEKVFYDAMKFFDDKNGIAMGDPIGNCLSIIITNDGGDSWTKIPCDKLPPVIEGEAAFAASDTNISTLGTNVWIATGGMSARIYHSSDMGKTWNVYSTPIIQGKATTGIYSVDFYDENIGIICGGDFTDKFGNSANKAITNDGGKTWTLVSENALPKYVSCVQYIPGTEGKEVLAVSTNGVFYSKNAGNHWVKVSDEGFYTLRVQNKNEAWLAGNEVIAKMIIE